MPPLILLPPSEGKAPGGGGAPWHESGQSFPELSDKRRPVIAALLDAMAGTLEARTKLLGVGAARTQEATTANLAVDTSPTLPAIERYTGVLYDALDADSLPAPLRKRLDQQVVILSGLWGAVPPVGPDPRLQAQDGCCPA